MLMNFSMYFSVSCSIYVQFDIRKERVCTSVFMDLFSVIRTESFLPWACLFNLELFCFPLFLSLNLIKGTVCNTIKSVLELSGPCGWSLSWFPWHRATMTIPIAPRMGCLSTARISPSISSGLPDFNSAHLYLYQSPPHKPLDYYISPWLLKDCFQKPLDA